MGFALKLRIAKGSPPFKTPLWHSVESINVFERLHGSATYLSIRTGSHSCHILGVAGPRCCTRSWSYQYRTPNVEGTWYKTVNSTYNVAWIQYDGSPGKENTDTYKTLF